MSDRLQFVVGGEGVSLRQTEVCRTVRCGSGSRASKEGQWIIEGYGVDPDIEVENDPKSTIAGGDPQLERGISEVMAKLKTPVKLPAKPPGPVKTIK